MTDRPDRPMSSEEMLKEARRQIGEREPVVSDELPEERATPPPPRVTPPAPASSQSSRLRPAPPEVRKQPEIDPDAQRRAVVLVAIAVSLVIAGFVAAIVFARAGI
ncbi:MAG: hypothetical protein QNJ88_18060 [Acidimicrobiia bacterium]|nr:hypothetical protein [Acidimicrobiia bacterium]